MGLTRKTSPRVWKTMGDTEFQGNSEIWRKFNGTTFCRSGAEKLDADDNKEGDHPTFCQIWPYNSFMEDKVFISSLAADATAWLGTLNDIVDNNWWEVILFDLPLPILGNFQGSLLRKLIGRAPDKKHHNLPPAGCGAIAVLTLLWYYRRYKCVQDEYPGIDKLLSSYGINGDRDSTLEDIMKKIWRKDLLGKDINYEGTAALFIRFNNLPFVDSVDKLIFRSNSIEHISRAIFEAVVLNRVPVAVRFLNHWAVISGVEFDYMRYVMDSEHFAYAVKVRLNTGNGVIWKNAFTLPQLEEEQGSRLLEIYILKPKDLVVYVEENTVSYETATTKERNLAICRRNEFKSLVGNNYEHVLSENCKYRKGEVVYITNNTPDLLISNGLGVVISNSIYERNGLKCYKVSFATQELLAALNTSDPTQTGYITQDDGTIVYLTNSSPSSMYKTVNCFVYVPTSYMQKVFSKDLDCVFFRETNGITANAQVYVNEYAVGQYIYDEPTLINKSNFLGLGPAYISKMYADTSCDVYFPNKNKTFHSAICLGMNFVMNFDIPAGTSTPAKFAVGEEVYYKQSNSSYRIVKVTSLNPFVASSAERWYLVKADDVSNYWKVREKTLYKMVWKYDWSKY